MNFNNTIFEASFGKKNQLRNSICKEIVFSGRSNVGKSSLINKLINRKSLARVSSKPGKTGTINFYAVNENLVINTLSCVLTQFLCQIFVFMCKIRLFV